MFNLRPERLDGIFTADAFQCHKTVRYDDHGSTPGDHPQQCAGLMAILHREGKPNTIMQVAERLGALDPSKLDPFQEAFASIASARAAHGTPERSTP